MMTVPISLQKLIFPITKKALTYPRRKYLKTDILTTFLLFAISKHKNQWKRFGSSQKYIFHTSAGKHTLAILYIALVEFIYRI